MKTTLNPFENAKRTAQGTGGVSPSVIEEIQAEITVLGSQNTQQAQDITDIKGSLNSINDNLSGFKFYPIGTQLVAYIEGHGWYNTDGKYVIWGTATANALVEASPNTYYGRPSEEDLRGEVGADTGVPFKGIDNINEDLSNSNVYINLISNDYDSIPVGGYTKIRLKAYDASVSASYKFIKKDGTVTSYTSINLSSTPSEINISSDDMCICFYSNTSVARDVIYGLIV